MYSYNCLDACGDCLFDREGIGWNQWVRKISSEYSSVLYVPADYGLRDFSP